MLNVILSKMTKENSLEDAINTVNDFLFNNFKFGINKTTLNLYEENGWFQFCYDNQINPKSESVYLANNNSAHCKKDSPYLLQNIFHEYFGHGLFFENSKLGIEYNEIRKEKYSRNRLIQIREENLPEIEAFAIWAEYFLSKLTDQMGLFEQKMKSMSKEFNQALDGYVGLQRAFGTRGFLYHCGMPKRYSPEDLKGILRCILKDKLQEIELALVYGSRKEYSDIDLFIISDKIGDINLGWLDVYSISSSQFEEQFRLFDLSITDPLTTGEVIMGDKDYLIQLKKKLKTQQITSEAIMHNLNRSRQQAAYSEKYPINSKEWKKGRRYKITYEAMAHSLANGKPFFTKKEIISKSEDFLQNLD